VNAFLVAVAAATGMAGVLLIVRGLAGVTTPLSAVVAELHRPRHPTAARSRSAQLVEQLVGKRTTSLERDLAVCERSTAKYVQDRFVWALLFAAPGLAITLLTIAGAVSWATPTVGLIAIVAGAAGGWLWARADLASDAERDRRQFRHALAAYLELVTILLSGGAGVETAMFDAVAAGRGPAFRHLRSSLSAAQARREAPWRTLGELGRRLGVSELEELEASMTLAGGGAQVRDSLTAKAAGIRMKDLSRLESEAQSRSETMVLPVALMFAGFLVLIGYPALAALSTP
jgi:tight adherence protein C